jgi:hypothetical protein
MSRMTGVDHLADLRALVRYRHERLQLYRAKVHGPRATSAGRLAELTREYELSTSQLKRATESAAGSRTGPS